MKKINLKSKFQKFTDQWSPNVIEEMNDYQFKLVKIESIQFLIYFFELNVIIIIDKFIL